MDPIFRKCSQPLALYLLCIALCYPILAQEVPEVQVSSHGQIADNATLMCKVSPIGAEVAWWFREKPIEISERIIQTNGTSKQTIQDSGELEQYQYKNLTIINATLDDAGNYTCVSKMAEGETRKVVVLDLSFRGKFVKASETIKVNLVDPGHLKDVPMKCIFELYNTEPVTWTRGDDEPQITNSTRISLKEIESTYTIHKVGNQNNGTYTCNVWDAVNSTNISGQVHVIVYDRPRVKIETVIAISKSELYLNWTTEAFNSKIVNYVLSYNSGDTWKIYNEEKIMTNSTSFVIKGFNKSTEYTLRLEVKTQHGDNKDLSKTARTLDEDPVFVPNISINGFSATSVTIGWAPPPENIAPLIHYYLLEARKKDGGDPRKAYHERDPRNLPYMFDLLDPHSTYIFKVRACQEFTRQCGNWSEEMEAATLDGIPGKPSNVTINCSSSQIFLTWQPPDKPNAEIKGYTMELTGFATYKDRTGHWKKVTFGPLSRFMSNDSRSARFDDLQPNTNFTVRLSAMTRTRRRGDEYTAHCPTKLAPPDAPPRPRWRKIMENERYLFKMYLPKVSERNGPICCYRVYMVRLLPHLDLKNLKSQRQLDIIDYEEAHAPQPVLGAYITDVFSNDNFPTDGEIIMGDDRSHFNKSDPVLTSKECRRCLQRPPRAPEPTTPRTTTTTSEEEDLSTDIPDEPTKQRRAVDDFGGDYSNNVMMKDPMPLVEEFKEVTVKDGPLDSEANYTLFVELIPGRAEEEGMFSDYINQLMPAPSPVAPAPSTALEIALQATCAVAAVVLLGMIIFCVMQSRRSRKLPPHAHQEMNPIQMALRYVVGHMGGRQQLVSTVPPDIPPIAKEDLAAAYAERHADSDYGFQKEFELLQMLSECFPDRTTHASEARENQPKNRYPDIKAYDQTRVKLSPVDGVTGSDYINANYVWGYKDPSEPNQERKKFICAQGPTDTTVNDFWRMIWEHGLELIVMLTNLEEYSKVKCSKYWPDEVRGARAFGAVQVHHVTEKRYSDYIVRELKITKQPTNSDGQPIVENNGVAKRNGDIKEASDSVPTSPREHKEVETRTVRQYHFLMWKDFAAPEHPHSILKFIKRVNEAWSNMVGRPVVVHCSAGVGRTGTLVALDCLLEQLQATGQATVFNTIAELRRQRNFLVQSQKQYVFVYRALVEYAHYGDTEIPASRLKSAIDRLRNTPEGADKCLMENEFEKMVDTPVLEPVKSCSAGQADELRSRNRSQDCLPYDRNRVMLTPIPGRDYSTYINASFIEAYDNSEGFIITQDPLPNTIFDFWRMVSEQSISTIVMLSELGDGKCPRYWDDGTAQYEHISVQYDESECCPYYTRRQFRVTNNKSGHVTSVRQLQYQGWPTAPGHVPEVTRGLAELADACAPVGDLRAPMLVHCLLGTERSALFVALCILITQLRTERRVDVNALARKVRAQRAATIDTFLQYEFLHRAILNYAELHNLLEDS